MTKRFFFLRAGFFLLAVSVLIFLPVLNFSGVKDLPPHTTMEPYDTDLLEYQTVAVNFAKKDIFPYMGFFSTEEDYQLRPNRFDSLQARSIPAVEFLRDAGPAVFLRKPPVYSFCLGVIYKSLGTDVRFAYAFNLLLLSFMAGLMPLMGYRHLKLPGLLCGFVAAFFLVKYKLPSAFKIDPETLLSFWLFAGFFADIYFKESNNPLKHIAIGLFLGFALLTKGSIIFIPLFYLCYLFLKTLFKKSGWRSLLCTGVGIFVVLLPWIVFANYLRVTTVAERAVWNERNLVALNRLGDVQNQPVLIGGKVNPVIAEYVLRHEYSTYAVADGFIIITPQAEGDQILAYHNELSVDGWWHPDWRFRKELYYNKHFSTRNAWIRVLRFYAAHPSLLFRIALAKLKNISVSGFPVYWLAATLFGICVIQRKFSNVSQGHRLMNSALLLAGLAAAYFFTQPASNFSTIFCLLLFGAGIALYRFSDEDWCPVIVPITLLNFLAVTLIISVGEPVFARAVDSILIYSCIYFAALFIWRWLMSVRA